MLDLGTLLRVPCIETEMGFDFSPDGRRIAFSWNPEGRWEIYDISLRGDSRPRLVSGGPGSKFAPRYSPDGRYLAFSVDFDGSEQYHIFLHEFATETQTDLTPDPGGSLQPYFAWSPDGKQIAFISDADGQFNVYVMPVERGVKEARQIFNAGFPAWKVHWSPDGRWLAVTTEAEAQNYSTFVLSLENGEARRIGDGYEPVSVEDVAWSPDSRRLVFCSDLRGNYDIGLYDLSEDRILWLTEGEGQKQFPALSPDGRKLAYTLTRGTVSWLAVQEIRSPAESHLKTPSDLPRLYQVEPGVHYPPHFMPEGRSIVFGFDNPRHPPDLCSWSQDGDAHQLTRSLPPELAETPFIMPQEITYPSLDGTSVPAMLFKPEVSQPGAAVLLVHGGPDWHIKMTWYPIVAAMASRGWVVLIPNYRGSTGYGRAWQLASRFDFGGVDVDDIVAGAHYLKHEGLAHSRRIAVTGRSHGGYLTACCLTRFPDLWAAGSAVAPFLNWFTTYNEIRPDLRKWDLENFGDPVKDYDRWRERSPSFFLERVRAPLQLICGRHDARCPVSDSIEATKTLTQLGKQVELVMYEDEGHNFLKMENVLDAEQRRMAFLAKYLT